MSFSHRLRAALIAAFKHFIVCLIVAALVAALVFGLWYPAPYGELAGGQGLFWLIVAVDVVCGPLLTLIIYNPRKPRTELVRDIGLVVLIQLAALGYGLFSLMQARPVWLAFERDSFRIVSVANLIPEELAQGPDELRNLSLIGPKPVGVRVPSGDEPDFLESLALSFSGHHPAFRPERWVPYHVQAGEAANVARPLSELKERYPDKSALINRAVRRSGREADALGFLPIATHQPTDWVVLLDRNTGAPVGYLPLDGWLD